MRKAIHFLLPISFLLFLLIGLAWPVQAKPPLNVELSSYTLTVVDNGVRIDWRTETELGTVGYFIKRRDMSSGSAELTLLENVGEEGFITAVGGIAPAVYSELDDTVTWGSLYIYQLVEIESTGNELKIAEELILYGATPTFTPTPSATPITIGLPTSTPIPPTNTPVSAGGSTATPTPIPTQLATPTAVPTQPNTTPTVTQRLTSTATAVASVTTPTTTRATIATATPIPSAVTGNATNSALATATIAPTNTAAPNAVLAQAETTEIAPYPAPDEVTPTLDTEGRDDAEFQFTDDPIDLDGQQIEPTPYPVIQATATPINLPLVGSQSDAQSSDGNASQLGNDTQGQLFLWLGFIIALLIFIVAVVGAIILFTRQQQ